MRALGYFLYGIALLSGLAVAAYALYISFAGIAVPAFILVTLGFGLPLLIAAAVYVLLVWKLAFSPAWERYRWRPLSLVLVLSGVAVIWAAGLMVYSLLIGI